MTEPEYMPVVLQTLSAVIRTSEGETRWFSAAEAEWVVRIHRAKVRLGGQLQDVYNNYLMARYMARAEARGADDYAADLMFAMTTDLLPEDVPGMPGPDQSLRDWLENGPVPIHLPTTVGTTPDNDGR